jgi:hypothetical protein
MYLVPGRPLVARGTRRPDDGGPDEEDNGLPRTTEDNGSDEDSDNGLPRRPEEDDGETEDDEDNEHVDAFAAQGRVSGA